MKFIGTLSGKKVYADPNVEPGVIYFMDSKLDKDWADAIEEQAILEGIFDTENKKILK